MTPKEALFYNAIALMHVNKKGGEMLNDFSAALKNSGETLTIRQLLDMTGESFLKTNANEAMSTGQAGFGAEFVQEVVLSSELIERLQVEGSLLEGATIKTMTAKTLDLPVRGAKIRMVGTSENSAAPTGGAVAGENKKAKTASVSLEAKTLIVTIYYSDELLEDSVINIAEYVMGELTAAYETSVHEIIINGDVDTGATTNINIIDGNTSALPDGNKTDFLKFDGIRKIAITKSATVDAGGNLALENIRTARAAMGAKGLDPSKLRLVPDISSYFELMNLSPVETMEKFGDAATVKNGVLVAIDGIKIVSREEMVKATATGEISATPANNTKGAMAIVHVPSMIVGIRRGLTTETSRYVEEQLTGVTGSARIALNFNDIQNNKGATSPAALIINI